MKYFKKFSNFSKINEASEFGLNIFSLFKPFGTLLTKVKYKVKLTLLINKFDAYLYDVFVEYLRRGRKLPIDNLSDKKIDVIGEDKTIHVNDGVNDGVNKPETKPEVEADSDTSISSLLTVSPVDASESKDFIELLDELIDKRNIIELKNMQREYSVALKRNMSSLTIAKDDYKNYSKEKKKEIANKLKYDQKSSEYKFIIDKIKKYDEELMKFLKKSKDLETAINAEKWYLESIEKAIVYTNTKLKEDKLKEEEEKQEPKKEVSKETVEVDTTNGVTPNDKYAPVIESTDWKRGAVYDLSWSVKDLDNLNKLVNPFQIEEFFLKADVIISNVPEKERDGAKKIWDKYVNNVYKKWYYTFDVRNLKSLTPRSETSTSGTLGKKAEMTKNDLAYVSLILEEMFYNIKSYSYRFKFLIEDKNNHFILLSKNNMLLVKKILFTDNVYGFQLLCLLKPDVQTKTLKIEKMLNTTDNKMSLVVNDKEVSFYKEENNYPIFLIKDGDMYSSSDFKTFKTISLLNCNIYSLTDTHFKNLIKNSQIEYKNISPSEESFDLIKNIK